MCGLMSRTWSVSEPWPPKDSAMPDDVIEPETNSTPTGAPVARPSVVHWPAKNVWMSPEKAARSRTPLAFSASARLLRSPSQPLHSPMVNGWPGALSSAISIIELPHSRHAGAGRGGGALGQGGLRGAEQRAFGFLAPPPGAEDPGALARRASHGGGSAYWCKSVSTTSACAPSG